MLRHLLLVTSLALFVCACGEDTAEPSDRPPLLGACTTDTDCPTGLRCETSSCVADDDLPPEEPPAAATHLPPVASQTLLWTFSPETARVTAIDSDTLAVQSFSVPAEPISLAALPESDRVFVLSRQGATLSSIEGGDEPRLLRHRLDRRFSSLTLSPDGDWAVLWNPDGAPLDAGLEGLIQVVDLSTWGAEVLVYERMVGRRPTEVLFRSEGGRAVDAVIVSKDEVAVVSLPDLPSASLAETIGLDDSHREPTTRSLVASSDGALLLVGSLASPTLLAVDVAARALGRVELSGPPTDLAYFSEREVAVAVLRTVGRVAWFRLSDASAGPGPISEEAVAFPYEGCEAPPCLASPGQVRFAGEDRAILFSNAAPTTAFAILDLETGASSTVEALRKPIRDLSPSPDGAQAIVLHQAVDSTRADPYEKWVDESEGYSIVDLESGRSQLRLSDATAPHRVVFARGDRYAGVVFRDEASQTFGLDAVDLSSLVSFSMALPSMPEDGGPVGEDGRIWISQKHPLGRISFIDLASRSLETITGYDFNARIE